jgi:uncharacterized protein
MQGSDVTVRFVPERRRFEARLAGREEIGILDVTLAGSVWTLGHTEVPRAIQGRGVGSALVRAALAHVRAEGAQVLPTCSFVLAYLRRHPEDADLVHERFRPMLQRADRG